MSESTKHKYLDYVRKRLLYEHKPSVDDTTACLMCLQWIPAGGTDVLPTRAWYVSRSPTNENCSIVCEECQATGIIAIDYDTGYAMYGGDVHDILPIPQEDEVLLINAFVGQGVYDSICSILYNRTESVVEEDN